MEEQGKEGQEKDSVEVKRRGRVREWYEGKETVGDERDKGRIRREKRGEEEGKEREDEEK